jgi:hypothetical protein
MHQSSIITKIHVILTKYLIISVIVLLSGFTGRLNAQEASSYDEISVFLKVSRIGGGEIDAVIMGDRLYLPVTDLFDFLKIRNIPDPELKSISGFFINQQAVYSINGTDKKIIYQDQTYDLKPEDIIHTENNLYLLSSYFGKVFGLECSFDFRSLSVAVDSKLELPLIREMKQEEMRKNLKRLKGETKADTTIGRTYPGFKFGMADWSINSAQEIKGTSSAQMNLALGAMVAGGETTASLYYNTNSEFNWKYQQFLWRYVNNDFGPFRQISAGKIATNSTSTIFNPVFGVQFTNTPTTYRRSFGTYTLSDHTEPGWVVELYVNNVLVDYLKADASGFFSFEVPLVYGNSVVNLKFIGPWGEEKIKEQNFNIPFTFLPVKTFEYNVNAGIVMDSLNSKFSRVSLNYGLFKKMTIGGGVEYLSSVSSGPAMPYVNTSMSITSNLLLSSEYAYGVRSKSTLTYRLPSNMQFNIDYTLYHKNQTAIRYNYREERRAAFSLPLRIGKYSTYQRLSFNQIVLPATKYTTGEWLFSGSVLNINTNLTTYALFISQTNPNIYSSLALSFRLPAGIICMPQIQYGYTQSKIMTARIELQKHLFTKAYLNVSFEHNNTSNINIAQLQFRYDFSFAQAGFTFTKTNKRIALSQYARGSLINDRKSKYLGTDNRTNVGKGGIAVFAFVDLNSNGKRDAGEQKIYGLNLHTNGGRVEKSDRDSTIRILGLEPYTSCFIEIDPNSFDNVSWKLPVKTLNVAVDPDIIKNIEIPVSVVGEATGYVTIIKDGGSTGQNRMIVDFYSEGLKLVGKTLTEDDGYFTYLGLAPGNYTVRIDTNQLHKLGMISDPALIKFTVDQGIEGDVVNNLNFTIKMKSTDTSLVVNQVLPLKTIIRKDTSVMIIHEVTQELVTISKDSYAIQLGAFRNRSNAESLRLKLEKLLGKKVEIVNEGGFFKVRITGLEDRMEVDENISILKENGITEVWLISQKAKQQQLVYNEKQDTVTKITETIDLQTLEVNPDITMQLGAFRLKSNAIELKNKFPSVMGRKIEIIYENGYYKVRISGASIMKKTVIDEMNKLMPSIHFELKDIWLLPVKKQPEAETTAPSRPENVIPSMIEGLKSYIDTDESFSARQLVRNNAEPVNINAEPPISLQVAVYPKENLALKAQRKIRSKLNLPVEIIEKWGYYHVIVTGFYTREETYKYYPELAGIGFPGISLIEKK